MGAHKGPPGAVQGDGEKTGGNGSLQAEATDRPSLSRAHQRASRRSLDCEPQPLASGTQGLGAAVRTFSVK